MRPFLTDCGKLVGKTIEGEFEIAECMVLTFTDGTYAAIQSECGYEGERGTPYLTDVNDPSYDTDVQQLLDAGISTQAEYDEWQRRDAAQRLSYQQTTEVHERAELTRLQNKYGVPK